MILTHRAYTSRAGISLGWVHAFRDGFGPQGRSILELELKSLRLKGDRVVAPTGGPIRTKDAADCAFVLIEELLKDQLRRRPIRSRLTPPLAMGTQGGYRSGTVYRGNRPMLRPAREVLAQYAQRGSRGFPWGAFDPARRRYLLNPPPSPAERRRGRPIRP